MANQDTALLQTKPISLYKLYDVYAGMLLGYILEIVKDKQQAEDYLIKTFSNIAQQFNEINWDNTNTWCLLQRFAKNELADFTNAVAACETPAATNARHGSPNKYLDRMTDEQKHIFCNFYYYQKTTSQLAAELNKSEKLVRESLKEAFVIIKRSHDN